MPANSPDLLTTADDDLPAIPIETADERVFSDYYDREVKALVDTMEFARQVALAESNSRKWPAYGIVFPICLILLTWAGVKIDLRILLYGAFGIGFLLVKYVNEPLRKFEATRDDSVIPKIVAYFPGFKYQRDSPAEASSITESAIIPRGDRQVGGDRVQGVHSETQIVISEIKTTEQRGSGKNRHTVTLFKGLLMKIEFEKPFSGVTLVERESGSYGFALPGLLGGRKLEPVSLEDPDFEKEFRVRSTDQVEARYLLTPDFMVRLHDISVGGQAQNLRCSFVNRKFYLAIPTDKDYFELGGASSTESNFGQALGVYCDIRDVVSLVDILKINAGRRVRTGTAAEAPPLVPPPPPDLTSVPPTA